MFTCKGPMSRGSDGDRSEAHGERRKERWKGVKKRGLAKSKTLESKAKRVLCRLEWVNFGVTGKLHLTQAATVGVSGRQRRRGKASPLDELEASLFDVGG